MTNPLPVATSIEMGEEVRLPDGFDHPHFDHAERTAGQRFSSKLFTLLYKLISENMIPIPRDNKGQPSMSPPTHKALLYGNLQGLFDNLSSAIDGRSKATPEEAIKLFNSITETFVDDGLGLEILCVNQPVGKGFGQIQKIPNIAKLDISAYKTIIEESFGECSNENSEPDHFNIGIHPDSIGNMTQALTSFQHKPTPHKNGNSYMITEYTIAPMHPCGAVAVAFTVVRVNQ